MWRATKPDTSVEEVLACCIDDSADESQATRLRAISTDLLSLSQRFDSAITSGQVHTLNKADYLWRSADAESLKNLYKKNFAKAESAGRPYYDQLRLGSQWCCACGHKRVKTLDHYLPKSKFPALSITPYNLTPMCKDCNEAKSTAVASTPEEAFFHPYFEDVESVVWLGAAVVQSPEPHVEFSVIGSWPTIMEARLQHHLSKFKLNDFYSKEAARLASQYSHSFEKDWHKGGLEQVRFAARDSEESLRVHKLNSWQAASWCAFADSDWFCDRGYLEFTD